VLEVSSVLLEAKFPTIAHSPQHASQHCKSDILYCLRNCLLETIQRVEVIFIGCFLQVTPQKKAGGTKSWELGGQMLFEMRRSPTKSLSMFMVSLAVWQVARLAETNSHFMQF
jgi:hypothetical protein